jgi:hypothetical protein
MIELLKNSLELIETAIKNGDWKPDGACDPDLTIQSLKHAIKEWESQEPVAWQFLQNGKWHNGTEFHSHRKNTEAAGIPIRDLYTYPPQRTWVGLTKQDKDLVEECCEMMIGDAAFSTIDSILKGNNGFAEEKNTLSL